MIVETTTTVSINCHGCRYFSKRRPKKGSLITIQLADNKSDMPAPSSATYPARVAWVRKSRRLEGLYQVGAEFVIPRNIWNVDEVPEDWAAFSPVAREDPTSFVAEVDRILRSSRSATYYQLLDVKPETSRSDVKRHFYQLARRFHPDHHMDHPEWTPQLLMLMDALTTAYKTLSDDDSKRQYDSFLARGPVEKTSDSGRLAREYIEKARECMAEKNYAGSILWLHRAIEIEPNSSSYRAMLGRCLSSIPEYRKEAVEQFEMAIEMDPQNLNAHFYYGELLEQMKLPGRARFHYHRVLELDLNHGEARERLTRIDGAGPYSVPRPSLFGRLTGRRSR